MLRTSHRHLTNSSNQRSFLRQMIPSVSTGSIHPKKKSLLERRLTLVFVSTPSINSSIIFPQALRLLDPSSLGYVVRWPIYGPAFNTRDYPSNQLILSDIESIIRVTLKDRLNIEEKAFKVIYIPQSELLLTILHLAQEYSVVLVIPDFYDRFYVQDLVKLLLSTMGFKQLCAQQVIQIPPVLSCSYH